MRVAAGAAAAAVTVFDFSFRLPRGKRLVPRPPEIDAAWLPDPPDPAPRARNCNGKTNRRAPAGHDWTLSRLAPIKPHASRRQAALAATHPAVLDGRTLFPTTVVPVSNSPRLLIDGHNQRKIGAVVRKGPWRGLPIFTLTLEERATCPQTCGLWRECYGNAMPFSRRHRDDGTLIARLDAELARHLTRHPRGCVVRLHILGDFFSVPYVTAWASWMELFPGLRVFGFTAWAVNSEIGGWIEWLNREWPERWVVRFSEPPEAPRALLRAATTIWRQEPGPRVPEGIVCPAQTGGTDACATCGLCWAPQAAQHRIVFIGHGMRKRGDVA